MNYKTPVGCFNVTLVNIGKKNNYNYSLHTNMLEPTDMLSYLDVTCRHKTTGFHVFSLRPICFRRKNMYLKTGIADITEL